MAELITIPELIRTTLISGNVDSDLIKVVRNRAQDLYIEPILGTKQYLRMLQGVEDDDLTTKEEELLGYIKQVLQIAVELRTIDAVTERIKNIGTGVSVDEDYQANSVDRNERKKDISYSELTFYKNRLKRYLKQNEAGFPLYKEYSCEDIKPEGKTDQYNLTLITTTRRRR
jgi:hypothetical protein